MKSWCLPALRRRVGVAIRDERTALGVSQSVLATHLHRDVDFVGKIERGEQNITMDTLERICKALIAAYMKVHRSSVPPPAVGSPGLLVLKAIAEAFGISLPPIAQNSVATPLARDGQYEAHDKAHDDPYIAINSAERQVMESCRDTCRTASELMAVLGYSTRTGHFKRAMQHLVAIGMLALTRPASPRSKNQQYQLTPKGKAWLVANPVHSPSL
jgi:transcriptional regulator with XRE-family HTH domain